MTMQALRQTTIWRFIAARHKLQERHAGRFARELRKEFKQLAGRVAARYRDGAKSAEIKAPGDTLVTLSDIRALMEIFGISEQEMYAASAALTDEVLGVPALTSIETGEIVPHQLPLPSRERIASRVTRITDVTRRAIDRTIRQGIADNLTNEQIANNLRSIVGDTYKGRADTIARTEMALIDQEAAHDRYESAGLTHVRIFDGSDCGWTNHEDPDKANGTIRTITDSRAHPVAHPNCVRASAPEVEA